MGCFLFEYEFWWHKIYACFDLQAAYVMQNFWNLGASGGRGDQF